MRRRRVIAAAAATAGLAAGCVVAAGVFGAPAASAAQPGPWEPVHSQPYTRAAGVVCPFAYKADVVRDEERGRTLLTYPDGSPQEQEFTGPLFVRFTNLSSGASVVRNLGGTAWIVNGTDGSITGHGVGHVAIGILVGNPASTPTGQWVLSGTFDFTLRADGTRDFTIERGSAEDLCQTLA
ncbi:MAG TPA: hypothetical protein VE074_11085 [Jatrophihabitantaceae bacterium]|nr:hypothetical protein [Jatrophihabitantaceae bacterium]